MLLIVFSVYDIIILLEHESNFYCNRIVLQFLNKLGCKKLLFLCH